MKPGYYEEDFLVIDGALDPSIFPPAIAHAFTIQPPDDHDRFSIEDLIDYPDIDFDEFRDHI